MDVKESFNGQNMHIIVDTIEKNDNVSRAREVVDCTDSDIVWSRWVTTLCYGCCSL